MFETRFSFSFSFSRLFRLGKSRAANTNEIAGAPYSGPQAGSRRPISSHLEPINVSPTPPRRSLYFSPLQNPVSQPSLPTSPAITPPIGTPPPIIIIGQEPFEPTDPLPPAPAPPGDIGPQIPISGVSLLPSPPAPKQRRVSFQLPIPDPEEDDGPLTPLSSCSTLVSESGEPEGEFVPVVSRDYSPTFDARHSGAGGFAARARGGAESAAQFLTVPGAVRSETAKARHKSLFAPHPVRVDMSRFSLPISPAARIGRPESKRASLMPIPAASGSSMTKKEKRTSRWSREMNKPETQEVLRALSGF